MKKIILAFVSLALLACSSEDTIQNFNSSTTRLDGETFTPNNGTYWITEGDASRQVSFLMYEGQVSNSSPNMFIMLSVPFAQNGLSGDYYFGFGEASQALATVTLYMNGNTYNISNHDSLHLTDLGDSRFRFEFTGEPNLDVEFQGTIEGTFTLVETE